MLCEETAQFSVTVDEQSDTVVLVGSTTQAFNVSTSMETTSSSAAGPSGPVVVTLSARTGQRSAVSVHADNPESFYAAAAMLPAEPGIALVAGFCSRMSPTESSVPPPYSPPVFGGVCVARVPIADPGGNVPRSLVSMTDPTEIGSILQEDSFSNMVLSPAGDIAYIAVTRTVAVNAFISLFHTIIAVDTSTLEPLRAPDDGGDKDDEDGVDNEGGQRLFTRHLPNEFQAHVRIAVVFSSRPASPSPSRSPSPFSLSNTPEYVAEPQSSPDLEMVTFDINARDSSRASATSTTPQYHLVVAYAARVNNKESLVVRRLAAADLSDMPWWVPDKSINQSSGLYHDDLVLKAWAIEFDIGFENLHREGVTTVDAICVSPITGAFAVMLQAPALIDSFTWNRRTVGLLTNSRTGLVAFPASPSRSISSTFIAQSWRTDWWQPYACAHDARGHGSGIRGDQEVGDWIVVGADRGKPGTDRFGIPMPYLSTVSKPFSPPSPSPSPAPSVTPPTSRPPSPVPSNGDGNSAFFLCVGLSSHVAQRSITDVIAMRRGTRLQLHVLRNAMQLVYRHLDNYATTSRSIPTSGRGKGRDERLARNDAVRMLCVNISNKGSTKDDPMAENARLCATQWHIVRWQGTLLYMRDLCVKLASLSGVQCREEYDVPINFKAKCGAGQDIQVSKDLSVTMHAGGPVVDANGAAWRECALQRWAWIVWWISTL